MILHNIHRYFAPTLLLIHLSGCSAPGEEHGHAEERPPNIVFIMTDDQGWGDLSMQGNTNLETPNIDGLGVAGAVFDRFYVEPVCSPTRAELLTGRYAARGGVYSTGGGGERLDLDETTIGQVFQQAGYRTAAFGKWHNGMQYPYHPNGRGFDEFYGFCSGHWGNYFSPMLEHNGKIVKGEGFVVDDFTDRAMAFMELNRSRPFFVYLPYNTPHSPMQVPDRWWDKFSEKELVMQHRDPDSEDLQHTRAALAMCENIDWNVGRLVRKLEELQLLENTIILYLSDNGPNRNRWNGGMKGRKGSTDEGGVRSPLIVQWKGFIEAGRKISEIGSVVDFLPTLAELAGIEFHPPKPLDGVSLKPLLLGEDVDWPDRHIVNHWRDKISVRSQRYRLGHEGQLFDIEQDPGQYSDVADQFPDVLASLQATRSKWEAEVLPELPAEDSRTFPLGHPDFQSTQIPARDGKAHGNIKRSNRWPNCSFFTNWTAREDKITWEVEVVEAGDFDVELFYTCPAGDVGSEIVLSCGGASLTSVIGEAHDPPLLGMENDRYERVESYVKDFKAMKMGKIRLEKGKAELALQAKKIPGDQVMDFRLLMFNRIP